MPESASLWIFWTLPYGVVLIFIYEMAMRSVWYVEDHYNVIIEILYVGTMITFVFWATMAFIPGLVEPLFNRGCQGGTNICDRYFEDVLWPLGFLPSIIGSLGGACRIMKDANARGEELRMREARQKYERKYGKRST